MQQQRLEILIGIAVRYIGRVQALGITQVAIKLVTLLLQLTALHTAITADWLNSVNVRI
jgi:hypothetical protein